MGRIKKYNKLRNSNIHSVIKIEISRETSFYGPGVDQLLGGVEEFHSIALAAQHMSMSYNKALRIINEAEQALGYPLVERKIGGVCGGGSNLTERAKDLRQRYNLYEKMCRKYAEEQFLECFPDLN